MSLSAVHLLCVEDEQGPREGRCSILETAGYHSVSASPRFAEILMSYQKFDLVIFSVADDHELNRLVNLIDGADILVLSDDAIAPADFVLLVAERLRRRQAKTAEQIFG